LPGRQSGAGFAQTVSIPVCWLRTQTDSAPQLPQLGTMVHSVGKMHGPQHELRTLGTVPAGQAGGSPRHVTSLGSQLRLSTQRPSTQAISFSAIPFAWQTSTAQVAGQLSAGLLFGSARHEQQSLASMQSALNSHSGPPKAPAAPPAPAPAAPVAPDPPPPAAP